MDSLISHQHFSIKSFYVIVVLNSSYSCIHESALLFCSQTWQNVIYQILFI